MSAGLQKGTWAGLLGRTAQALRQRARPADLGITQRRVLWDFEGDSAASEQWVVNTDEALEGKSKAEFQHHSEGFARFAGHLSTSLPADGKVIRSGFALVRSKVMMPTLFGSTYVPLAPFHGLEATVRGDGRPYIFSIKCENSLQANDLHQATLYTRGGPHWQTVQIPFSDFVLTNTGYVQDEQRPINMSKVEYIGFTLSDRLEGPFCLDVKNIHVIMMPKELTNLDVFPPQ